MRHIEWTPEALLHALCYLLRSALGHQAAGRIWKDIMAGQNLPTQQEADKFYATLGSAITDWSNLEQELFEITAAILDCTRERAAIVFYRTPTVDSRVTLTSDLVHSMFPRHRPGEHPHLAVKTWKDLQAAIKDNLSVRNRLAHHPVAPVVDIYESEDGEEHRIEIRQASYISRTEHLRRREQAPDALGIEEIDAHMKIVSRLINRLRDFRGQEFPRRRSTPDE
jgi:hypothetical protein